MKNYFFEKISNETMQELDAFLRNYPDDEVDYWVWRNSLTLYSKVCQELADSTKGFGEKVDEILNKYDYEKLQAGTPESYAMQNAINRELDTIAVTENVGVRKKLELLCKKHY